MTAESKVKKFMYLNRRAPHGTIYAFEALEMLLIGAAFNQDVSAVFLDDGVYQLVRNQDTRAIEIKNFSRTFRALEDYDVKKIYVERESLASRGLTESDLLMPVELLSAAELAQRMTEQDVVLSF